MEDGINVLSCFDGMSCGQIALKKLGVKVNKYYASEIDKWTMEVTKKNFPKTIQLGDIKKLKKKKLKKLKGKITLAIAGSPCQGFSFAGKQLNFDDPRSKLFFDFVRIIKIIKPKYFLLENVYMKQEYQDVISEYLGVQPIEINSNLISAQNRKRLYWTNIPNVKQPKDKHIYLKDILEKKPVDPVYLSEGTVKRFIGYGVKFINKTTEKARCLAALEYIKNGKQGNYFTNDVLFEGVDGKIMPLNFSSSGRGKNGVEARLYRTKKSHTLPKGGFGTRSFTGVFEKTLKRKIPRVRKLTPIECERLQTVPDNYSEGQSNSQRYKMLGNGFTVDSIAHILKSASFYKGKRKKKLLKRY